MKKFLVAACLLVISMGAQALFEKGKWFVNPSITGLDLSYSKMEDTRFGFSGQAGAFLADNVALLVNAGAEWTSGIDVYSLGVGGRYYFDRTGIFLGTGLKYKRWDWDSFDENDVALGLEAGYAFFLSRTVTIEPAVYYDISFKEGDYSKVGLKVGFGFYF